MNLPRLVTTMVKKAFLDDARALTSKRGLATIYRISLYRNAVYLMLNSVITAASGFAFWVLAARLYLPEEVGLASAALAAVAFLVTLSNLGLDYGLVRYLPGSGTSYRALVNSCLAVGGLVAVAVSLVFLGGIPVWSPDLGFLRESPLHIAGFVVLVAAFALYVFLHATFVAHQRAGFTLVQAGIQSIAKLGLVATLPLFLHAFGIFAAWGIGLAVALVIGLLLLLPRLPGNYRPALTIKPSVIAGLVRFSLANYIAGLLTRAPVLIFPLMIVGLLGAEQNAYFYMAYAVVSNALLLIPAGISLSLFAEGSHDQEALGTYFRKSLKFSLVTLIPLIVLVLLVGDKVLLLFGEAYSQEATRLLWILAVSSLPLTINMIYFHMKRVEKKMKGVIGLNALTAIVALGLSYFLLPELGILGAGIGWLAGNGLVSVVIVGIWLATRSRLGTPPTVEVLERETGR